MTKKTYLTPTTTTIHLHTEGMIASSDDNAPGVSQGKVETNDNTTTNRLGWDSSNWSND